MYLKINEQYYYPSGDDGFIFLLILLIIAFVINGGLYIWFIRPLVRIIKAYQNRKKKGYPKTNLSLNNFEKTQFS